MYRQLKYRISINKVDNQEEILEVLSDLATETQNQQKRMKLLTAGPDSLTSNTHFILISNILWHGYRNH